MIRRDFPSRATFAFCAIAWGPFGAGTAAAQAPTVSSEAHIRRGAELRGAGRDQDALAEFEAAEALDPTPRARAQIALAQQALGEWVPAEAGLDAALAVANDPWVDRYRPVLERALEVVRGHLGWLEVDTNVAGAQLFVNEVPEGDLPRALPVRLPVGSVSVELRATGYETDRRTSIVSANGATREHVVLVPLPALAPTPTVTVPAARLAPEGPPPSQPNGSSARRTAGFLALGGAGISAAVGVVAWQIRLKDVNTYNDNAQCLYGALTRDQRCGGYASSSSVALGFEIGFFAMAGLAALTGGWLIVTPKRSGAVRLSCAPSMAGGAKCGGTF